MLAFDSRHVLSVIQFELGNQNYMLLICNMKHINFVVVLNKLDKYLFSLKTLSLVLKLIVLPSINPFSTNFLLTGKAGGWFLLAKCLKNTCGRVTF